MQVLSKQIAESNDARREEQLKFQDWTVTQTEFYKLNLEGLKQHTAELTKQQNKFEVFERVVSEFNINIEALKTHALSTDLHLESSLPLQIASIAFEVGQGTIMKKQFPKFRKNFKKRIDRLEKNFQDCSDPFLEGYESIFRKNFYELPDEYLNPTKVGNASKASGDSGSNKGSAQGYSRSKEKRKSSKRGSSQALDMSINDLQNAS